MEKEKIEALKRDYKKNLYKSLNEHMAKSEEAFDSKLFAISSAGLTLLFSEFAFTKSHGNLTIYIIAVILFGVSLFLNLYIHKDNADSSKHTLENGKDLSVEEMEKAIRENNNKNEKWTNANMLLLFFAIVCSFCYILSILK